MSDAAPGRPPWRALGIVALAGGLLLRVGLALAASRVPPVSDMREYVELSHALAAGSPVAASPRALLYPLLVAQLEQAGGQALELYLVQGLVGLAAALGFALCARSWLGAQAFWPALILAAPSLTLAQYGALCLTETPFVLLFAAWLALVLARGRSPWRVAIAGAAAGLAVALRPAALPLVAGTALALAAIGRGHGADREATPFEPARRGRSWLAHGAASPAIFLVAALVCFALAMAGVAEATGAPATALPTAGVNLYLGNAPNARADGGGLSALPPALEAIDDPRERDRAAGAAALAEIRAHPARALGRALVRLLRLAAPRPGRVEHDALVAAGLPPALVLAWLAGEWTIVVLLAAVGLASSAQARRAWRGAVLVALPYVVVLCSTFVQTRFRLPLHLLLLPFAAEGLAALGRGRAASGLRLVPLAVAAVLLGAGWLFDLVCWSFGRGPAP